VQDGVWQVKPGAGSLWQSATLADLSRTGWHWLALVEHEMMLFASIWFAIFAIDELLVDAVWLWLRFSGRARSQRLRTVPDGELAGMAAVLVPAWSEAHVIGAMIARAFAAWPQRNLRIYVGCYRNDCATIAALIGSGGDERLRIVVHDREGPTTKADCLNRLYRAVLVDEARRGHQVRAVILHDAEDMVHPAALNLMDRALDEADFVQFPVRPETQRDSRWIGGHYCDEFAEAHARDMVVRQGIGAALPAAGVGCAFSRKAIERIVAHRGGSDLFAADCLTEDYECGLLVGETGGRSAFLRARDPCGALVATREFFPSDIASSVRQKTRWVHGIAFQGWERMGWPLRITDLWMRMRDRRGPLVAMAMAVAYALVLLWPVLALAEILGLAPVRPRDPLLEQLLLFNLASLLWRLGMRGIFTAREYGAREGLLAMLRLPVGNVIAIMSTRRAVVAYLGVLMGGRLRWEHTIHRIHPFQGSTTRLALQERLLDPLASGSADQRLVGVADHQCRDFAIASR